jgi:hypothetical protein
MAALPLVARLIKQVNWQKSDGLRAIDTKGEYGE